MCVIWKLLSFFFCAKIHNNIFGINMNFDIYIYSQQVWEVVVVVIVGMVVAVFSCIPKWIFEINIWRKEIFCRHGTHIFINRITWLHVFITINVVSCVVVAVFFCGFAKMKSNKLQRVVWNIFGNYLCSPDK